MTIAIDLRRKTTKQTNNLEGRLRFFVVRLCSLFYTQVLVRGVVFARMSPEQKQQLVEAMQEIG